ncbi:hypothetical protein JRO89_XS07G0090000 [Xanthoceras sorbifolium]|uniref:Uncharacterized protein n=1 Tax=Xanthoceras sorbifolium TaxID=99658 RepID=A0ABQ8HT74_9ROSI|nr:hypothetical protein JRO89_XS07G0090000 [Xanthoceras sorbifolium]
MVSDASSGPRHYCEDDEDCFDESGCFCSPPSASASELAKKSSKKKKKTKEYGHNQQHSYLDDTASSPVLGFSKAKEYQFLQERSFNGTCLGFFTRLLCNTFKVFSGRKTSFRRNGLASMWSSGKKMGMTAAITTCFVFNATIVLERELGGM